MQPSGAQPTNAPIAAQAAVATVLAIIITVGTFLVLRVPVAFPR